MKPPECTCELRMVPGSVEGTAGKLRFEFRLAPCALCTAAPDLLAACHRALASLRALNMVGIFGTERTRLAEIYEKSPEIRALKAAIVKAGDSPR